MAKKKPKAKEKRVSERARRGHEAGPAEEVLDLGSAAAFLKVSKPTFYRWLAQGKIKGHKAGQQWRFYRQDLEQFLHAEEPSALLADAEKLRQAVEAGRKARGLRPADWTPIEDQSAEESAVIRAVDVIMQEAIDAQASDIHLDNTPEEVVVRYRIDGVLHEAMRLPRDMSRPLVSRLKLLGDMNISERRAPQHGRIAIKHKGKDYDLRVTTIPAMFGESAITRILDQSSVLIGMERLGFSKEMQRAFERVLHSPTGLVIAAGPAGCGKTTTLYSALNLINSPRIKILTIENPVEYQLRGLVQVHVNRKAGLTTAVALRTFVRCDPDIIFVGDLQDLETAEACMQAAMTGHLVLTTMLPPNAPSVVTRLIEMGVEPFLASASLKAVLAQRLARRVCPKCKADYRPNPDLLQRLEAQTGLELSGARFQHGKGCEQCRQSGYRGRAALFELLEVNEPLRELIARPSSTEELRQAAMESGMTTLLKDGVQKAMEGVTTIEEVLRVLQGQPEGWQNPPSVAS